MDNNSNEEIPLVDLEPLLNYTGTQINYYFVCKRKLWLFSHNIDLEQDSDLVLLGKILHEQSYNREVKEIDIERIKIDFINKKGEIHEVKRSMTMEKAHLYQLLYYLYFIKVYTKRELIGVLNYPLLKKRVDVTLDKNKEEELKIIMKDIDRIIKEDKPPEEEWKSYCKTCAYNELCWA
jgi:CRISPR-associated exonuclease Cas4